MEPIIFFTNFHKLLSQLFLFLTIFLLIQTITLLFHSLLKLIQIHFQIQT